MSEHRKSRRSSSSSSSGSSSRRRSSSSRKSSKSKDKKSSSILRRMFEMLFGVGVGVGLLAGLVWFFVIREPEIETQRRVEVENSVIDGELDPIQDFQAIRDTGTVGDMKSLLMELNDWPKGGSLPTQIDYQKKRVEIADRILDHENRTEFLRELATNAKIEALGTWYGLDFKNKLGDPLIANKYQAACKLYEKDDTSQIRREAFLGKAKTLIYEFCKGDWNGTFTSVENSVLALPREFPNDAYVLSNISGIVGDLRTFNEEKGISLFKKLAESYKGMDEPKVVELRRRLSDIVVLSDSGVNNLIRGNWTEEENLAKLYQVLLELSKDKNAGETVIQQIGFAINGLEKVGRYDLAEKVCKDLKANSGRDPKVDEYANGFADDGLQRLSLLNKPFSLAGVDIQGNQIDVRKFRDKVVVILYWSPRKSNLATSQFNLLQQLHVLVASSGVKFVTVQIEDVEGKDVKPNSAWVNVRSTPEDPSPYTEQCPINRVPYFVLIGRDGKCKELHIPYDELKTKIDLYASRESYDE